MQVIRSVMYTNTRPQPSEVPTRSVSLSATSAGGLSVGLDGCSVQLNVVNVPDPPVIVLDQSATE